MRTESDTKQVAVRIALGSNLGIPRDFILRGWDAVVAQLPLSQPRLSSIIASAPAEGATGGTFANAVGVGYTGLDAYACLAVLQQIERAFGRDRAREGRYGARTLDLDMLDWDGALMNTPTLQLPHPRSHGRAFVLGPWAELEPTFVCSCCGLTISTLAASCSAASPAATTWTQSAAQGRQR